MMFDFVAWLSEYEYINIGIVVVLVLATQGIKRVTPNWEDWMYIALVMVTALVLSLLSSDLSVGAMRVIYDGLVYALIASGVYSYAKRIPFLKNFLEANGDTKTGK